MFIEEHFLNALTKNIIVLNFSTVVRKVGEKVPLKGFLLNRNK